MGDSEQRVERLPGTTFGRPPLILQEKIRTKLLQAIRIGNYQSIACRYAGISVASFQSWIGEGRDARILSEKGANLTDRQQFFLDFLSEVEEAEAIAEASIVGNLMRQTATSPQAALGMLAVRFPDRWREKKSVEISGPDGGPVAISPVLAGLPDDVLEDRIRALEREVEQKQIPAKVGRKKAAKGG